MDPINRNQSEENHQDLSGPAAIVKIKPLVENFKTCLFCTAVTASGSSGVRPLSVQPGDDAGNLWFLSAADSHKNEERAIGLVARFYFQGPAHSDFFLDGMGICSQDRARIEGFWEPIIKPQRENGNPPGGHREHRGKKIQDVDGGKCHHLLGETSLGLV